MTAKEKEPKKVSGLALAGFGGAPFVFAFWLFVFPVSWVKLASCSGRQQDIELVGGKLVLAEYVWAHGEEGSNIYDVMRVRVLDPKTGANVTGPFLEKGEEWLGVVGDTATFLGPKGIVGLSLNDGSIVLSEALLAQKQPALQGHLRRDDRNWRMDPDRLCLHTDDGRWWAIDAALNVTPIDKEPVGRGGAMLSTWDRAGPLEWKGQGDRRRAAEGAPDLLRPSFVYDYLTQGPISTLASHHNRLDEGGHVDGLFFSLIDASGKETWRFTSKVGGHERVLRAVQVGDVALVQTVGDDRGVHALSLKDGTELWKRGW